METSRRLETILLVFVCALFGGPVSAQSGSLRTHPTRAAAYEVLLQKNDDGTITKNGRMQAIAQSQQLTFDPEAWPGTLTHSKGGPSPRVAGLNTNTWEWLGPANIGGRVRSILINPTNASTMWIGSVGGGVWKTTNGGGSWVACDDFMANIAIGCMALDPLNPDVLYAGTGEGFGNFDAIPGGGIFKSYDGGASWTQLSAATYSLLNNVNRLAICPSNHLVMLAATGNGIWRSTDGGTNWTRKYSGNSVKQVAFDPMDGSKAFATPDNMGLYSTDAGQTWIAASGLNSGGRNEFAYAPSSPNIIYVSANTNEGSVFVSSDSGVSFSLRNTGNNFLGTQGWYDNGIWVDPTNPNVVLVGGQDWWRSVDGGNTFTDIGGYTGGIHSDQHIMVNVPSYNGSSSRSVVVGNDGGVFEAPDIYTVSPDSGWTNLNNGLGITQFYGGAVNPTTLTSIGGTQDNGTPRYRTVSGTNWTVIYGGDGGFCAADPTDPNYFYGEYIDLEIFRTTNGGATASPIFNGIGDAGIPDGYDDDDPDAPSSANFIAPFVLDPNNPNTMLGGGSNLWRSVNIKAATPTWTNIKPGANGAFINAIAVAPGNSDVIWVGHNNGDIYATFNGTTASPTWVRKDLGSPNLPNRTCTRLAIDPFNPNVVYAAFGGFNSDNLYRTSDNGLTWTNIASALPAATIYSVVIAPFNSTLLYVGSEVGVFGSANGGMTWSPANEGPANVSVRELFWGQNYLFAATHGRGVYRIGLGLLPVITAQPISQSVSVGNSASFCIGTTATVPVNYVWQKNGAAISGATQSCYTFNNAQPSDSGSQFQCLVSSSYGSVTSSIATLTVASAPLITQQPQSQSLLDVGTRVVLNVGALGQAPLSYQWSFNGTILAGATNTSVTLNNVQATSAGRYQVTVGNSVGTATSSVAALSVAVPPVSGTLSGGQLGFTAHCAQVDYPGADESSTLNSSAAMEAVLGPVTTNASDRGLPSAGQLVNPQTGLYCANTCDFSNADVTGCFFVPGYINMDIDGPTDQQGDFTSTDGVSGWPKQPFPGIPGDSSFTPPTSEFAMSYTAYVYLPTGVTQFGVNSDDGFMLTLSSTTNPNDAFSRAIVGQFDGGRGSSDTIMSFNVPTAGPYALRLDYEQGRFGASCELFTVVNGTKILVNDTNVAGCLLAYPTPEVYSKAYAVSVSPAPGQTQVPLGTPITVLLQDGVPNLVNVSSILLRMNGQAVIPTITATTGMTPNGKPIGNLTTIYYSSAGVSGGVDNIELSFADSAGNLTDRTWAFTYETALSTNDIVSYPNQGSTNSGFVVYPWHTTASDPNDVQIWAEEQLLGLHGSNLAVLTDWPNSQNYTTTNAVAGPQGSWFTYTNYINWDLSGPNDGYGDFTTPGYPKQEFPGIITGNYANENGFVVTDGNNFSMLVEAWLQFPTAGTWQMGVNSDDGFSVKTGQTPGDIFGQTVGLFEGGRGAADTVFSFFVPQPGLYPFRLLYQQGLYGGLCEWFTITPSGQRALINDASQGTNAIYSYLGVSNCPIYVSAVTPVIGASGLGVTPTISASIVDGSQTHVSLVQMLLNGSPAPVILNRNRSVVTSVVDEQYGAPLLIPGATNQATIIYGDDATARHIYTNSWNFVVDPFIATQLGPAYYQSPGTVAISCTVRCATNRTITALTWQPTLPVGWTLASVAGGGSPRISGSQIAFNGPFNNPLNFTYSINIPAGQTNIGNIFGQAVGQISGITGTVSSPAAPFPFAVNHGTVLSLAFQNDSPVLTLQGDIGRSYRIQSSTNLDLWSDLFSVVPNSTVVQTNVNRSLQRAFYRAITP